jgi:hypothetical protein
MSGETLIATSRLREIILGKVTFRLCPNCDKGRIYVSEEGVAKPEPQPEWNGEWYSENCDNCDGLGYIPNPTN